MNWGQRALRRLLQTWIKLVPINSGWTKSGWLGFREPANKSHAFSVGYKTARYAKVSEVKCLDLFKLTDNVDGRYRAHPLGLTEQSNRFVNDFRKATSMPVIIALRFNRSVCLSRIGLVRRFPNYMVGFKKRE